MEEVWKDIKGYEGIYQVSNLGRIKSFKRKSINEGLILKPHEIRLGYLQVTLYDKNKRKIFLVHRLVAMTFIPNPQNKPEINHKDGNSSNNKVSNLEWCTHQENIQHAWDNGLQVVTEKQKECGRKYAKINFELSTKKIQKKVRQYDLNNNFIKEWDCMNEAERQLKICNGKISACCKGKRNKAGGFKWRYAENE